MLPFAKKVGLMDALYDDATVPLSSKIRTSPAI